MAPGNRERKTRWRDRLAALIVLTIIMAIVLLAGRCGGGPGNPDNNNSDRDTPQVPVPVRETPNSRIFVLRFLTESGEFKSSQATLVLPDGTRRAISGYADGSSRPSIDLYYANLREALIQATPGLADSRRDGNNEKNLTTIYLEIIRDTNRERLQGQAFVRAHEEIAREYFHICYWLETAELDKRDSASD